MAAGAKPYLTADLPGTGGALKASPEDFVVEEIPAYGPCGEGEHVLATIEKVDLTTHEAVRRLARALGVRAEDVGTAGLKDRQAVTRQQISLPRPVTPEQALAAQVEGVRVITAARHKNKLKTGHLRGNRFRLVLRGLAVPADEAAARAGAVLARLATPPGVPNWYGEQRFGTRGDNAERGRALLRGERCVPPPRDGRERRLLLSAWQSSLFNTYLEQRLKDGLYATVITGDILEKTANGACFATTDPGADQARLERGEVVPTGPMFGGRMPAPVPGSDAAARETALLAGEHLKDEMFSRHGLLSGTRRALGVVVAEAAARPAGQGAIEIELTLPPGCYATVVAAEVIKA